MTNRNYKVVHPMDPEDFRSAEFLDLGDRVKIVVRLECAYYNVFLVAGVRPFRDEFNDREPYDALTHVFYVPVSFLTEGEMLRVFAFDVPVFEDYELYFHDFMYTASFADPDALYRAYDSGIKPVQTVSEQIAPGLTYSHMHCKDRDGRPVQAFLLTVDPAEVTFRAGTPDDGFAEKGVCATVPEMIAAAEAHGKRVLAAVNADFFDMFGDNSPSGLCVKDGRVVANGDSLRPFFGIKRDGTAVIASLADDPALLGELREAVAGLQMLIRDGEVCEWGPLEPFAFVRHPRTAVGLRADGTVLLLVVDGRIPDYSNGATLVDLIQMLRSLGAVQAVNLDGGGSSIVYTRSGEGQRLRSNPADLYRPLDKLIRPCFDCILVTAQS